MAMQWYVLRVASNKEEQVRDTPRKMEVEGVKSVGRIIVPVEQIKRIRGGKHAW